MRDVLKDVPRFLLAENNQIADGKVYIVCADFPFLFLEAEEIEPGDEFETSESSAFSYYLNQDGDVETHYIKLLAAFGDISKGDIFKLIKEAADWYTCYLGFLDGSDKVDRN